MEINREGCTRIVILTNKFAFKVPNFLEDFKLFLHGLLANMTERQFAKANYEGFCPIAFSIPFGVLVVMPKAQILTEAEFLHFDYEGFRERENYAIPAENKANSFGWLNGEIVAVDYGN